MLEKRWPYQARTWKIEAQVQKRSSKQGHYPAGHVRTLHGTDLKVTEKIKDEKSIKFDMIPKSVPPNHKFFSLFSFISKSKYMVNGKDSSSKPWAGLISRGHLVHHMRWFRLQYQGALCHQKSFANLMKKWLGVIWTETNRLRWIQ